MKGETTMTPKEAREYQATGKMPRARDLARRKPVTVGDLERAPRDAVLLCDECGESYSSTHGDYSFRLPASHVLRCCGKPMRLVRKVVRYETVRT